MHIEDAAAFIVKFITKPSAAAAYSDYGYDIYVPNVIAAYLVEVEKIPQHLVRDHPRGRELTSFFFDAAWDFCAEECFDPACLIAVTRITEAFLLQDSAGHG